MKKNYFKAIVAGLAWGALLLTSNSRAEQSQDFWREESFYERTLRLSESGDLTKAFPIESIIEGIRNYNPRAVSCRRDAKWHEVFLEIFETELMKNSARNQDYYNDLESGNLEKYFAEPVLNASWYTFTEKTSIGRFVCCLIRKVEDNTSVKIKTESSGTVNIGPGLISLEGEDRFALSMKANNYSKNREIELKLGDEAALFRYSIQQIKKRPELYFSLTSSYFFDRDLFLGGFSLVREF